MSEAEKPEPKTGKRIVSKREYVKVQTIRAAFMAGSGMFLLLIIGIAWELRSMAGRTGNPIMVLDFLFAVSIFAVPLLVLAMKAWEPTKIDPCVPLTRANTGDLPAPDSLVRASAEPLQAQEVVLLRAAAHASETPVEQLVRPVGGQG